MLELGAASEVVLAWVSVEVDDAALVVVLVLVSGRGDDDVD